ncbi:MAG: N-acetyltransferase [Saprospiraceae bacterium]|nr:N-acetyltransferase [Saprospiraceae bacterium]
MITFKEITVQNYPDVQTIYLEGIQSGMATFQTSTYTWEEWDRDHLPFGRIAAYQGDIMSGWASLSSVSGRCVYKGVAELSIYIATNFRGQGIGTKLLEQLITISEENGIWTINGVVFAENEASIRIHKKCGFRVVGIKEKIGQLNGQWKDNMVLERRSKLVGI